MWEHFELDCIKTNWDEDWGISTTFLKPPACAKYWENYLISWLDCWNSTKFSPSAQLLNYGLLYISANCTEAEKKNQWNEGWYEITTDACLWQAVEVKGLGKSLTLGQKMCETKDLMSSHPQMMTVSINTSGSIKLSILVTWKWVQLAITPLGHTAVCTSHTARQWYFWYLGQTTV